MRDDYVYMIFPPAFLLEWWEFPDYFFFDGVGESTGADEPQHVYFKWSGTQNSQNTSALAKDNGGTSFPKCGLKHRVCMFVRGGTATSCLGSHANHVVVRVKVWPEYGVTTYLGVCDAIGVLQPIVTFARADVACDDIANGRLRTITNKGVIDMNQSLLTTRTR